MQRFAGSFRIENKLLCRQSGNWATGFSSIQLNVRMHYTDYKSTGLVNYQETRTKILHSLKNHILHVKSTQVTDFANVKDKQ
jgi:replication fork clamp-binding protein CrfC